MRNDPRGPYGPIRWYCNDGRVLPPQGAPCGEVRGNQHAAPSQASRALAKLNFDIARFGMERMSFSPRQADVLICAGRVPYKLAPVLRRIWDQMPQPKWAISMGACASSGGVFDTYTMVQGIDTIIPVDVYIPGCPPRPEALIYGLMMIQEKIREERLADHAVNRAEDPLSVARPRAGDLEVKGLTGPFGNSTRQNRVSGLVQSDRVDRPEDRLP